ncbi:MAG TPA: acyltransferase family protein [Steroidobacteraceae bacterium]|jgi:peptidoglycan/LPS O-acetylase OafA/YrhL|nr:acyltransferase family protein [Steroidobacteraceae bacterium]
MGSPVAHQYRPDIDGLRALAVLAVVAFHATPLLLPGGFLGVDVFFVISGYLISGLVLAQQRAGSFTMSAFYLRRARRILPALLLVLFISSLLALLILMPDELQEFAKLLIAGVAFVPNLVLYGETGYFDVGAHTKPLLHLWSLGVEEQFYFVWPVIMVLVARRNRPASTLTLIAVLAGMSFVAHLLVFRESPQASFYLPFTRFWELMIGALLAAMPAGATPIAGRSRWLHSAMSILGILLIVGPMSLEAVKEPGAFVGIAPTLGAAMFIIAGPHALPNRSAFSWRPVVYIGLISYPLYLWHWPLLSFLRILQVEDRVTYRMLRLLMVVLALAAAILTYHLVERPVRKRQDLKRLGAQLGVLLLALGAWGGVILATDGFPRRTTLVVDPVVWPRELRVDPRCMKEYGQAPELRDETLCVRNDYDRPPQIILLGDSHANAWWPGVLTAYPDNSILDIGASACLYLRHTDFWQADAPGRRGTCPNLIDIAYRAITPDTRLVILAARNTMYVATAAEYAETFEPTGVGHFSSLDFPAAGQIESFERSLVRDLSLLLESDREVTLVLQVPELNFLPRPCLHARPYERVLPGPEVTCSVPRARVERRQANYRAAIARAARAVDDPDLHVVDPMDALCDATECYAMIGGVLMYRDDDHLSVAGSRYVWEKIRPRDLRAFVRP